MLKLSSVAIISSVEVVSRLFCEESASLVGENPIDMPFHSWTLLVGDVNTRNCYASSTDGKIFVNGCELEDLLLQCTCYMQTRLFKYPVLS